jgi:hypothetical protein
LVRVIDLETLKVVTNHVWFSYTQGFEKANISPGVIVEFEARVKTYKKGYANRKFQIDERQIDFKLSHPTRITVISRLPASS